MPLAGTPPFYEVISEHNQRATARARSKLACCASSPETEQRARAEGSRPLANVSPFYEVPSEHNQRGTARASDELKCCASSLETVRRVALGAGLALEAVAGTLHYWTRAEEEEPPP